MANIFVRFFSAVWRGLKGAAAAGVDIDKLEQALSNIGVDVDLRERAEYLIREAEGKFRVGGIDPIREIRLATNDEANTAKYTYVVNLLIQWGAPRWLAEAVVPIAVRIVKAKFGGKVPLLNEA